MGQSLNCLSSENVKRPEGQTFITPANGVKPRLNAPIYINPLKCDEDDEPQGEMDWEEDRQDLIRTVPNQKGRKRKQVSYSVNCPKRKSRFSLEKEQEFQKKKIKLHWKTFIKIYQTPLEDDYHIKKVLSQSLEERVVKLQSKMTNIVRVGKYIIKQNKKGKNLIKILKQLDHPNLPKLHEVYEQEDFYIAIMDYCEGINLSEKIKREKLSQSECLKIMKQIFYTLHYLHLNKIIVRNIKQDHFILQDSTNLIKLTNLSKAITFDPNSFLIEEVGDPDNYPPEIIKHRGYDQKFDIWGCGVLFYKMLFGQHPFKTKKKGNINYKILYEVPPSLSESKIWFYQEKMKKYTIECYGLLLKVLQKSYKNRISAKKALDHPWFANYEKIQKIVSLQKKQIFQKCSKINLSNKLTVLCRVYITRFLLTEKEKQKAHKLFQIFDKKKNGVIEMEEFRYGLNESVKIRDNQLNLQMFFKNLDLNCSGKLEYSEFMAIAIEIRDENKDRFMKKFFQRLDRDDDGFLNKSDFLSYFDGDEGEIEKQLKDVLTSEKISFSLFKKAFTI